MACFAAPAAEAVITTIITKAVKHYELKHADSTSSKVCLSLSKKLGRLSNMLWGGSALLMFEHIWHGEITMEFPFLTAASDPAATAEMLGEIATSGTAMALLVTAVWAVIAAAEYAAEKRTAGRTAALNKE